MAGMMQILKTTLKYRKLVLLIYGSYLLVATAPGIVAYCTIQKELGNSVEIKKLIYGFDRTVIGDMMNSNKQWSDGLMLTFLICSLLYFLCSIFINAGLITSIHKRDNGITSFFTGGIRNYIPFFGYAVFFYIALLLIAIIFYFAYTTLLGNPIDDYHTEKPFVYSLLLVVILFLTKAAYLWIWSLFTRFNYLAGLGFWKSMLEALKTLYRKFFSITILLMIVLSVFIFIMVFMNGLHNINVGRSWMGMIVVFLLMQVSVLFRHFVKVFAVENAKTIKEE